MRVTLNLTWHVIISLVVLVLLTIGVFSFASYKLYSKIQDTERAQKELARKQIEARFLAESEASKIIETQRIALSQSQAELLKAQAEAAAANKGVALTTQELASLSKKIAQEAQKPKNIVISSEDLTPYITGVVQIICSTKEGVSSGSGTLWNFKDVPYALITNKHVIKDATACVTAISNKDNKNIGLFSIKNSVYSFNQTTDSAILAIGDPLSSSTLPLSSYNYSASKLPPCTSPTAIGTPIVIIGYPVYAKREATLNTELLGTFNVIYRTVTNGIISGYDTSQKGDPNYFVSAKIDNGNSGGLAIAKDAKGLCQLGLPTWLTVGNYETQALVQNITNILPIK